MFKYNLKSLFVQSERILQQRLTKTLSTRSISEQFGKESKNLFGRDSRLMQNLFARTQKMYQQRLGSSIFNNFRRNFSSGSGGDSPLDRFLNILTSRLPNGNIAFLIIALNSLFYFFYLIWPRNQMYSYLNNFTFSKFNMSQGRLHTFLTCHFTHMSFFTYVLDSVIMYLFCQNLLMMYGSLFLAKTVFMSIFLGSFLLFL